MPRDKSRIGIHGTDAETKRKTECPLTAEEFGARAKALIVNIGNQAVLANPRTFESGSFGFFGGGRLVVDVGGTPVECQVGLNITVIGSKPK